MGSGVWTEKEFSSYTCSTKGARSIGEYETKSYSAQELYKAHSLSPVLNPLNVMRECRDSAEHPNTFPVILALDVTGSMGGASVKVAQKLNSIMTSLYADDSIKDIEFCIMGIGDLAYDDAPIQMSQFESDIRIAEQLDAIYFEGGGGGNKYESYTAAWYMGVNHCDLDCWKRGQKGLIITMGDELPNPVLPRTAATGFWKHPVGLTGATGDNIQGDVETSDLITETLEKFNVYHISVNDNESSYNLYKKGFGIDEAWTNLLGDHYKISTLENLTDTIVNIIKENANGNEFVTNSEEVNW